MHIPDATLRAKLDGELPADESLAADRHLSECARCTEREREIEAAMARTGALLGGVAPAEPNVDAAYTRVRARLEDAAPRRRPLFALVPRPIWGALCAVLLVTVIILSGPARAVAQRFLALFRVQAVVAVPVEKDLFAAGKGQLIEGFAKETVKVTKEEAPRTAGTREEAAALAGFAVRLPSILPGPARFRIEGARAFEAVLDAHTVEGLISVLGRPDLRMPEGVDGTRVMVDIPRAVVAAYGQCGPEWKDCVELAQAPSPSVVTSPELNLAPLAEIGLQLTGMSPEEARTFSRTIDWSSTLAIPVPRGAGSYEPVAIEGVHGVQIRIDGHHHWPGRDAMLWVKNGIIHSLMVTDNPSLLRPLAESLQ